MSRSIARSSRLPRVMQGQFKSATKSPNEYIKFYMDPNDCCTWYILLSNFSGDNGEFQDGEYLVRMVAPEGFPTRPPEFYFKTENGVYGTECKVCISIGEFHSDQYRAVLGMAGFADQLVSGMIGWRSLGGGISIVTTSAETKARLASESRARNRERYPQLIEAIEATYTAYSSRWQTATPSVNPADTPADTPAGAADKPPIEGAPGSTEPATVKTGSANPAEI